MTSKAMGRGVAASALALRPGAEGAQANNGDTHITGQGIDCNESTMQGSSNVVFADNIVDNVIVDGNDQTLFCQNAQPYLWDRGRELGTTNRIDRVPA